MLQSCSQGICWGIYTGAYWSSQLRQKKCSGLWEICFYLWYCKIQLGKHCSPTTHCKEECVGTTDHTPNCLAEKETARQSLSTADTVVSLREHLGEEREGTKEKTADFSAPSTETCPGGHSPPDSLHLASWGVGMLQAFAVSSFIFNDSLSLLRSRYCISPARSWGRLKLINAHEARKKREPVVWPSHREENEVKWYLKGSKGCKGGAAGTSPANVPLLKSHEHSQPRAFLVYRVSADVHYVCYQLLCLGQSYIMENIMWYNEWLPIYLPVLFWPGLTEFWKKISWKKPNRILALTRNIHWRANCEVITLSMAKRRSELISPLLSLLSLELGIVGYPIWALVSASVKRKK